MNSRLAGKCSIITGGGSGIGRAIAHRFGEHQSIVYILELNDEAGNACVKEIRELGGQAYVMACDVSDQSQVDAVVKKIYDQQGRIDLLVNNAGIAHVGTVATTSEVDFDRLFQVNVKGAYNLMHAVVPFMLAQGGGVILNMASVAATTGIAERFAYSMTKGAILSMTLSVARDYVKQGIRCNCISPARVHTPFVDGFLKKNYPGKEQEMFDKLSATQPIGRMGTPEEIAGLALYLCSDEAAFITGCDYPVDGGFTRLNT